MENNLKKQLVKFNVTMINTVSLAMFVIAGIIAVVIQIFAFGEKLLVFHWWDIPVVLVSYVLLIALHEAIHALTMIMVGVKPKSIKFGVIPKQMMVYCTTTCPVKVWQYAIVLLMPLIITGIIPLILATAFLGLPYMMLFALLVAGAAGDVVMFFEVIKYKPNQLVQDHPTAPAFYLLYPEDKLPEDFKEVTEEEEIALRESIYGKRKNKE